MRIRKQADKGVSYLDLAAKMGVHNSFIGSICRGKAYADVGGPIQRKRNSIKSKGGRKRQSKAKRTTTASSNGRPKISDFAALSIDDAARFLQALAGEWPKIRESFLCLDAIVTRADR
jgi:hypothetical protein